MSFVSRRPLYTNRLSSDQLRRRISSSTLFFLVMLTSFAAVEAASPTTIPAGESKLDAKSEQLQTLEVKQGVGAEATTGKPVLVHYTGWLYDPTQPEGKGKKFDSSRDRGVPFGFFLGAGKVIKGWDDGVVGMKVGGQRRLVIPPQMAYGERGAGGVIPANATLVFDVELVEVK